MKRFYNGVTEGLKKVCGIFTEICFSTLISSCQGPWIEEEDRRLEDMVRQHGQAWAVVASQIRTRSADRKKISPVLIHDTLIKH